MKWGRWLWGAVLAAGGIALLMRPDWAPALVLVGLAAGVGVLVRAWRAAWGTELRAAVVWGGCAIGLGMVAQAVALGEPYSGGRPGAGHWSYLALLATLASLLSVLNARRPGANAWAVLMALLIVVFLVPWLEGVGLARGRGAWDRLRLDAPWTWFFGLLIVAATTNHLPTRYGSASALVAAALVLEELALTRVDWPLARRGWVWSAAPWLLAVGLRVAAARAGREPPARSDLERLWFWFRDHWGVVWALRLRDRFNQSATASGWPVRLAWHGFVPAEDSGPGFPPLPDDVAPAFRSLFRRFADPDRLDAAAGRSATDP